MNDRPEKPTGGHLNTVDAAEYMGISRRRMDRYREEGDGPRFRKFGQRILYAISDLDAWSAQHSYQSTYEPGYPAPTRHRRGVK
jgi:predicted DNA-binding transcriptional regulator AlpA